MKLRTKLLIYLIILHLIFAGLAVAIFLSHRNWLIALEAGFLISLFIGINLINKGFGSLDLIRSGVQFIEEKDFTARFIEIGSLEMDQLIRVYNKMAENLKNERTRLQEQNYLLEKLLEASPSGVLMLDFDGKICSVNSSAEKILHIPAKDLLNKKLAEIDATFLQTLNELLVYQSKIIPLQGGRRIKCQRSEFIDRGFPRQFFLLEELTEELRRSEKAAYEKLIRMMSHEVNNSIGATNSLLQSCLNYKDQLSPEDCEDYENALNVIIGRTAQLNSFMNSFADVIRLPQPKRSPSDIVTMLSNLATLFQAECQKRNIEWQWQIADTIELVAIDKIQMEQVFVNIIKNAIEAIGKNGVIKIKIDRDGSKQYLAIIDNGEGIPAEIQEKLFTPFFSTKENGQGIGLTLVQDILMKHNFDFKLESQTGLTSFIIYF